MIEIRRATFADKSAIWSFLREAFPAGGRTKVPHPWLWQFELNPYVERDRLPIWLALDGDRVVGQTAMLRVPVRIGGRDLVASWGVDAIVLPEFRRQGIGGKLVRASAANNPVLLSLGVSDMIRGLKREKQGSVDLPPAGVYRRTLRQSSAAVRGGIARRVGPGLRRRLVASLVAATGLDRLVAARLDRREARRVEALADPSLAVDVEPGYGTEHDALWERVAPSFAAAVRRESAYLDWKYAQAPFAEYVTASLRRDGRLAGWIVLRESRPPEARAGVIADLLADPADESAIRALLAFALRWFVERKAEFAIAATSVPAYADVLRCLGFAKTRDEVGMVRVSLPDDDLVRAAVEGPWLLAKADADWDHYPSGF